MTSSGRNEKWDRLVADLQEPRTRRGARQKLVAAGAVEPLLECLDSLNPSVVWAAVVSLGELRAPQAVGPLLDLLEREVLVVDVCEALTRITGHDFGMDAGKWRQALRDHPETPPPPLDRAHLVARTGDLLGTEASSGNGGYRFRLSLPNGRSQQVAVHFGRAAAGGEELVVIYSQCGPANPRHYEALLRHNMNIPAGAFALRDVGGEPQVVMVDTMLASTVTPGALAKHIENIAARADRVEEQLTSKDRY